MQNGLISKSLKIEISEDGLSVWKNGKRTKFFLLDEIAEVNTSPESDFPLASELKDPNNPVADLLQDLVEKERESRVARPSVICSDRDMVTFGTRLSIEEKEYLHAVINRALLVLTEGN
ncbi:MAG: hypothetical protein D6820_00545 [Lentisphaerae bacterium]|nr:MAG: hypothetical protein D6820_00545 [Lentisphaerota bacterium]